MFYRELFQEVEYKYSAYGRASNGKVLVTLFYLTQGKEKDEVQSALSVLVKQGLLKCIFRKGQVRWDVAYRKGMEGVEFEPTKYALRLMKNFTIREFFNEKGLY